MPITTSRDPCSSAAISMMLSSIGTSMSTPSIEKRFWPEIRLVQEPLERLHLDQPLQQALAALGRERGVHRARLDLLAEPHALLVTRDVLHLVRERAAVGLLQVWVAHRAVSRPAPRRAAPRPGSAP